MADDRDEDASGSAAVDPIVRRAYRRAKRCQERYSTAHANWIGDYRFEHADARNNHQWPEAVIAVRKSMPSLTVNEVAVHNRHISNEAKQNRSEVRFRPMSGDASLDAARVFEGLYRAIKNASDSLTVEGRAIEHQIGPGLGYTVIRSRYIDAGDLTKPENRRNALDQEIYIDGVADPRSVWLDPDANEADGSDARFGFIYADNPRDEMQNKYPELRDRGAHASVFGEDLMETAGLWLRDDTIRQAEYYEVEETPDELLADARGNTILRSQANAKIIRAWEDQAKDDGKKLRRRHVVSKKLRCYTIVGDLVVDETDLPGTTVPIVPWIGTMINIDGKLDFKGHTRAMISAQEMLNYNYSASVQFGALQTKGDWLASARAIEGLGQVWNHVHEGTVGVLVYNDVSDDGRGPIAPPQRLQPPTGAPLYMEGIQAARSFLMSVSGQYEAELGAQGNERTGRAINERQRQGDRATYHFINNQAMAQRRQGRIIQEWIPAIYDTPRVLRILGEDGAEEAVQLDPQAKAAHEETAKDVANIFNPNVGRYEVIADVGPDYGTQRQEGFDAVIQIITQAPQLIPTIGDILFKLADFPLADEIAERLKPGLPIEAQNAIKQLQQHIELLTKQAEDDRKRIGEAMQALTEERVKSRGRDNDNVVKGFDADTRRLAVVKDILANDPADMAALIHETVRQALEDNLGPMVERLAQPKPDDGGGADDPSALASLPPSMPDVGAPGIPDPGRQGVMQGGM